MTTKDDLIKSVEDIAFGLTGVHATLREIDKVVSLAVVKDVLYVATEGAVYRQAADGTFMLVAQAASGGLKVVG